MWFNMHGSGPMMQKSMKTGKPNVMCCHAISDGFSGVVDALLSHLLWRAIRHSFPFPSLHELLLVCRLLPSSSSASASAPCGSAACLSAGKDSSRRAVKTFVLLLVVRLLASPVQACSISVCGRFLAPLWGGDVYVFNRFLCFARSARIRF